jgi:hypothetical protein
MPPAPDPPLTALSKGAGKITRGNIPPRLVAEFDQVQRGWAFADSAISVCAHAMADNKSVDDVLAQIRNHIEFLWNVNPALPFELPRDEPEKDPEA